MKLGTVLTITIFIASLASFSFGQSTEITYQGNLTATGNPASGNHDFEFALFDAASGGAQLGSTIAVNGVAVTNGIFSVKLDFGNQFPGANRFLEIRVRTAGGGAFTTLLPRQPVNSAPYSIKSINATNADNATTATSAANLLNPFAGDVTGSQSNTTVARLRGRTVAATQPNNGQVLKFNTTSTQWEPANDETASGGGGTITGVTAGAGLAGGGTTGSVTVAIATGGITNTMLADGLITTPKIADGSVTPSKLTGNVPVNRGGTGLGTSGAAGNYLRSDGTNWVSSAIQGSDFPAGSGNYIQNQNAAPQASSSFNISGSGSATSFDAANQYNIGGFRVLSTPGATNVFVGQFAGAVNSTGSANSFVGRNAGDSNTTGTNNSFFGNNAGQTNSGGSNNSFFGSFAGQTNTASLNSFFGDSAGFSNSSGSQNAFFGWSSGGANTTGSGNAFFGSRSGFSNTASENAFFGASSGDANTSGSSNSFFGKSAGQANVSGVGNSFFGWNAGAANLSNGNSFFGAGAGDSNIGGDFNAFFGSSTGTANTTGIKNAFFGTFAGVANVGGGQNTFVGGNAGEANTAGGLNVFVGESSGRSNISGNQNVTLGQLADVGSGSLVNATAIGTSARVDASNSIVLGSIAGVNGGSNNVSVGIGTTLPVTTLHVVDSGGSNGSIKVGSNAAWSATQARRILFGDGSFVYVGEEDQDDRLVFRGDTGVRFKTNGSVSPNTDNAVPLGAAANRWTAVFAVNGTIQTSDARLKKNIHSLNYGLGQLMKLRPVSFDWKDDSTAKTNLGFLAQEVEKIIPEAVVKGDDQNHTRGMNYSELLPVIVRSVQEQQSQIAEQARIIGLQQKTIRRLEQRLNSITSRKKLRK
ncbi:MAG: tail fiber domain-containing protein [Pyrinomonadaceae bacterium]